MKLSRPQKHVEPLEEVKIDQGIISYQQGYDRDLGPVGERGGSFTSTCISRDGRFELQESRKAGQNPGLLDLIVTK